jgi:predicted transcriptional regulator of viral defense system
MNYIEFQKTLKPFTVFSLSDIRQIDPAFCRRRLNEWQEKGYIRKIIKGHYAFADRPVDEKALFEIANKIYSPSYVSFEMALSYYGLIPESVYGVTSASTLKTSHFKTAIGSFIYRTIRPKLYFGFNFIKNNEKAFKLACPEKAFLDLFYIKTGIRDIADFEELRINRRVLLKIVDHDKLKSYLDVYNQASLKRRINNFWEYIKHA